MKRLVIIIGIIFLFNFYKYNINAESSKNIHVIYSDLSVEQNQEFMITLNFEQVELYYSIQIILELGEYFETVNDVPCELLLNSYYSQDEVYVNDVENNVIRFVAFKKTSENSSNFNNIIQLTLRSKITCNDVRNYLQNIKIGLFDAQYQTIPVNLITSEGIKVEWLKEVYELELGNDLPNFSDDILVSNRNEDEYIVKVLTEKININKVGPQVVTVYVYDFRNASCIILTKAINILDLKKPIITGLEEVIIDDTNLNLDQLTNYIVQDNYDQNLTLNINYYSNSGELIKTKNDFYAYLKKNLVGVIKVIAIDSSKNESNEFTQTIKINDTIPPNITISPIIEIKDVEIEQFNIFDYLKVEDVYDENPNVVWLINEKSNLNIVSELVKNYEINVLISATDKFLNKSEEVAVTIKLIDTTPPYIEKINDLIVNDCDFTNLTSMINNIVKTSDNFSLPLEYQYQYLHEDVIITKEEFDQLLFQGLKLKIHLKVNDQACNESNTVIIETQIIDTTPPTILVNNVEENKKYLTISLIDYQVLDNFDSSVDVKVLLDGENYQNTPINLIGKHSLTVVAVDASGNESTKTINFEIIKNNLIGCGLDADCYTENYQAILYIAFSILTVSVLVFLIKIIVKKNKTKLN